MKLLKSKAGFTLIELLVVIGILAVLAAIAIPSVAGLIDRANVSADETNANEMTNAIERFAAEYELYCQDIASGVIKADTTDFDVAQGRVYNVTQVKTRSGIETLEVAQDATVTDDQIAIYRDTKYPVNTKTMRAIVENYTKTSSATFDPKQSDMHFWYSPACGVVVIATPESSVAEKNSLVITGKDAKGRELDNDNEVWIDLTANVSYGASNNPITPPPTEKGYIVPEGGQYIAADGIIYNTGEYMPSTIGIGDSYVYGDYEYRYGYSYCPDCEEWGHSCFGDYDGWNVRVLDCNRTSYGEILTSINGEEITCLAHTFAYCENLITPPQIHNGITMLPSTFFGCTSLTNLSNFVIPNSVVNMVQTFAYCESLMVPPTIPNSVVNMQETFSTCTSLIDLSNFVIPNSVTNLSMTFHQCEMLTKAPAIPNSVTNMHATFMYCYSLTDAPPVSSGVTDMTNTFNHCTSLTKTPDIPKSVEKLYGTFSGCESLTGSIVIHANPYDYRNLLCNTTQHIVLTGTSNILQEIADASGNANVSVE